MKKLKPKLGIVPRCEIYTELSQPPLETHTHDFDELVFVFGGSGIHEIDDERYPLIRGDVFVLRGNHVHGFDETNNLHLGMILYAPDFFDSLRKEFSDLPGFQTLFILEPHYRKNHKFKAKLHLNSEQLNEVSRLLNIMKEEKKSERPGYQSVIDRMFGVLIVLVSRYYSETESPKPKALMRISSAISYMEKNYAQPVSVAFLAKHVYTAERTLRYLFKEITGLSPKNYLIRLRIKKAAEMMAKNNSIRVIDVSSKTGFDNSSYFSRKFKEIIGITPMNYLKQQRKMVE